MFNDKKCVLNNLVCRKQNAEKERKKVKNEEKLPCDRIVDGGNTLLELRCSVLILFSVCLFSMELNLELNAYNITCTWQNK